jgi:hypothetical protein
VEQSIEGRTPIDLRYLHKSIFLLVRRMVGVNKPNHSEEQSGTQEEQLQHAQQVRAYLDANAPRRQLKPARSDAAEVLSDAICIAEAPSTPPERTKYLQLLATGVPLETRGSGDVGEDFTESEYYQYMAAIDKAHHTTGTGFIEVDKAPEGFHLSDANEDAAHPYSHPAHPRCNPATNDWEPATNSTFVTSTKPSRSESTA